MDHTAPSARKRCRETAVCRAASAGAGRLRNMTSVEPIAMFGRGLRHAVPARVKQRLFVAAVCLLLLGPAGIASAQDAPKVGLTVAFPAAVGLLWQVSERFAIRPDFSFSWTSTKSSNPGSLITSPVGGILLGSPGSESVSDSQNASVGVSALFTVQRRDALRIYVAPRVHYSRSTATSTTTYTAPFPTGVPPQLFQPMSRHSTNDGYSIAGLFGAQYVLTDRFGLFGEVGVGYSWSDSSLPGILSSTRIRSGSIRSGVGVIVFF